MFFRKVREKENLLFSPNVDLDIDKLKSTLIHSIKIYLEKNAEIILYDKFLEYLQYINTGIKFFYFIHPESIKGFREKTFNDSEIMDFVMGLKSIFYINFKVTNNVERDLINLLALANSNDYETDHDLCLIPSIYFDSKTVNDLDVFSKILSANTFMIPLMLISYLLSIKDIENILRLFYKEG